MALPRSQIPTFTPRRVRPLFLLLPFCALILCPLMQGRQRSLSRSHRCVSTRARLPGDGSLGSRAAPAHELAEPVCCRASPSCCPRSAPLRTHRRATWRNRADAPSGTTSRLLDTGSWAFTVLGHRCGLVCTASSLPGLRRVVPAAGRTAPGLVQVEKQKSGRASRTWPPPPRVSQGAVGRSPGMCPRAAPTPKSQPAPRR